MRWQRNSVVTVTPTITQRILRWMPRIRERCFAGTGLQSLRGERLWVAALVPAMVAALVLATPEPLPTDQSEVWLLPIECGDPRPQLLSSASTVDPLPRDGGHGASGYEGESLTWQWCAPVTIVPMATSAL